MLSVGKDVVIIKVVKDVASYHMLLDLIAEAGERYRSVTAGLELLSFLKYCRHVCCSQVLWDISGIEAFLDNYCPAGR